MENNEYGKACSFWRKYRGYSQEYMAIQLGLRDQKAYSLYETGERSFDLPMLEAIARIVQAGTVGHLLSVGDRITFNNSPQAHAISSNLVYNASSEQEREQLKARVQHMEEEVKHLREENAFLRDQVRDAQRRIG